MATAARWASGLQRSAGFLPLREAIAAYLGAVRAVRRAADQVLIVSGSQQALDVAGARVCPVPVDSDGLDVAPGRELAPGARLAYVTPSHQYPLGVAMPFGRRLALLEWARSADAWVLEDDYDSEYRYTNRPLAALQGLDNEDRVIYIGSFSKVLFPGLLLGYLVVPRNLVAAFSATRALNDRHSPTMDQVVLADFIVDRHFERHVHRMRSLYAERQAALVVEAQRRLGGLLDVQPADTGMHLVGWLPPESDDAEAAERALTAGVEVQPLSAFTSGLRIPPGLRLGYAAISVDEIRAGVQHLARALVPN